MLTKIFFEVGLFTVKIFITFVGFILTPIFNMIGTDFWAYFDLIISPIAFFAGVLPVNHMFIVLLMYIQVHMIFSVYYGLLWTIRKIPFINIS